MCACQQYLSLLIIETYLVLVIEICYFVYLIHYKMIYGSVKWCILLNNWSLRKYIRIKNNIQEKFNLCDWSSIFRF